VRHAHVCKEAEDLRMTIRRQMPRKGDAAHLPRVLWT
jgi:hypothetical protein